jgi:hypothetical protein
MELDSRRWLMQTLHLRMQVLTYAQTMKLLNGHDGLSGTKFETNLSCCHWYGFAFRLFTILPRMYPEVKLEA